MDDISKDMVDEFLHGWCHILSHTLQSKIGGELWQVYEKSESTDGEWYDDHFILKFKDHFIDVSGIYTYDEVIDVFTLRNVTDNICITLHEMKTGSYSHSKRRIMPFVETEYELRKCNPEIEPEDGSSRWILEANKIANFIITTYEFKSL
jgi:hypothetical protein